MWLGVKLRDASLTVLACSAGGATAGLLTIFTMAASYAWGRSSSGTEGPAAWVQAIGSILAILASGLIAIWTVRKAEERAKADRDEDELALLRSCRQIARDAEKAHGRVADKMNGRAGGSHPKLLESARLKSIDESILCMLSKDIPPGALEELLVLRRELAMTMEDIGMLNLNPTLVTEFSQNAPRQADKRTIAISRARESLEDMVNS